MDELTAKNDLLDSAIALFSRFGIKGVTMDDLARELSISKKTIYKHVCNKNELVQQCCAHNMHRISSEVERIQKDSVNAIDEMLQVDAMVRSHLRVQLHQLEHQLMRYYPRTHRKMGEERREIVIAFSRRNLKRGIEESLYRPDIDIDIVAQIYFGKMQILKEESLRQVDEAALMHLLDESLKYHLRAIVSDSGLRFLESQLTAHHTL